MTLSPTAGRRPRIGITALPEDGSAQVAMAYIAAIDTAGGLPLILPPALSPAATAEAIALLDGLLIPGGDGIVQGLIGVLPDDLPPVDPLRWCSDTAYYAAAAARGLPVLGICYGMQFLNAMQGGTIYADVMAQCPDTHAHSARRGSGSHTVHPQAGTRLAMLLGAAAIETNSAHIQALAEVGAGLTVNAISDDGVIEGIESADGRLLGLQCHPERLADSAAWQRVFADFVGRCQAVRG